MQPKVCDCPACGHALLHVRLHVADWTLGGFVEAVLKGKLGVLAPSVAAGDFLYEEGA